MAIWAMLWAKSVKIFSRATFEPCQPCPAGPGWHFPEFLEARKFSSPLVHKKFPGADAPRLKGDPAVTEEHALFLIAMLGFTGPFAGMAIGWFLEVLAEIDRERERKQELLQRAGPIATASACPPGGGLVSSWKSPDPRRRERAPGKQAGPSAFGAGSGGPDGTAWNGWTHDAGSFSSGGCHSGGSHGGSYDGGGSSGCGDGGSSGGCSDGGGGGGEDGGC